MSPQQYQSGAPQMAYMPPQQQQRMIQQQPQMQMQPSNAAYLSLRRRLRLSKIIQCKLPSSLNRNPNHSHNRSQ
jgi:hypothetical protein